MRESHGTGQGIPRTLFEKKITGARTARMFRDEERGNGSSSRVAATCMATS